MEEESVVRYSIQSYPLVPPLGQFKFFAVVRLYKDEVEVQTNIGETFGVSQNEAEDNLKVLVDKWLQDNP